MLMASTTVLPSTLHHSHAHRASFSAGATPSPAAPLNPAATPFDHSSAVPLQMPSASQQSQPSSQQSFTMSQPSSQQQQQAAACRRCSGSGGRRGGGPPQGGAGRPV